MTQNIEQNNQLDPNRWKALFLLCFANFLVIMDSSIVQIALPSIKETLGYTQEGLQWVMNAFLLFFGGLLLLGGKLSDLYGSKRIFNIGVIVLAIASLFAGLAWSEASLNVSRAVQGIGSALIAPAALAMIMKLFENNTKEKGKALAFWGLSGAAGGAFGTVLGGIITDWLSWRGTLLIYVPLSILVLVMSISTLRQFKATSKGSIDYIGAILVTISLMLVVFGISTAEEKGWLSTNTLISLIVGLALFIVFVFIENNKKDPLVPMSIFKTPNLSIGNIGVFLVQASWFPMVYMIILYLQQVLQYTPSKGAISVLPIPLFMAFLMIVVAERVLAKIGIKKTMVIGFIFLSLGNLLFSQTADINGNYWISVLIPSFIASIGNALAYLASTSASVSDVKADKSGVASALYNVNFQVGSAIGLAIMVAIAGAATKASNSTNEIVALSEGFQQAFLWSGILAIIGAILSFTFVKK